MLATSLSGCLNEDSSDDSNSTPGFGIGILMVALLAGLMFNKRKTEIE